MAKRKNKEDKNQENNQEKYYYVSVRYDDAPEDSFGYRYISKNTSIKVNDRVLVPRGDSVATGHVIECEFYDYENVPYPVEYTKYVIKKIDEDYVLDEKDKDSIESAGSFYDQLCDHIVVENGEEYLKDFDIEKFRNKSNDGDVKFVEGGEENIFAPAEDKEHRLFVLGVMKNLTPDNIFASIRKIEDYYVDSEHYTKNIANESIDELVAILNSYDLSSSIDESSPSNTTEEKLNSEKYKISDMYFRFALGLILYPKNVEAVKLGISLIGIFQFDEEEEIMKLFKELSLCEELAKYMAFLYSNQPKARKLLLNAAKRVHGWGRINYIEKFDFKDYEMLEWFLTEGYENDIDSLYTSQLAAERIDLIKLLNEFIGAQDETSVESSKVKRIINTLLQIILDLNEGPNSFEEYEKKGTIYPKYSISSVMDIMLELKDSLEYYPKYYELLISYMNYINDKTKKDEEETNLDQSIMERITSIAQILESYEIGDIFKTIIQNGGSEECEEICRILITLSEVDVADELFEKYEKNPLDMMITFSYLMYNEDYRDEAYKIMKNAMDWKVFCGNPEPLSDSATSELRYILRDLEAYPFYDEYFINIGLNSYDCYCRYIALNTLKKWKEKENLPIYRFPSKDIESLIKLKTKEIIKDNKIILSELLADLKDLKEDAKKTGNDSIMKLINIFAAEENLDNYEEPRIIYK